MNSIKKRIGAFVLAIAMAATALPADFIGMGVVRAEGEEVTEKDVTGSSDLTIDYSDYNLKITTTDNQVHDFTFDSTTNTYVWPSDIGVAQVKEVSGQIQFDVKDASSDVKKGTYFSFKFPEVLQMNEVSDKPLDIDFGDEKHQLGTYSVKDNVLTFHFTWDKLGESGISVSNMKAAFTAGINKDALGNTTDNRYELFKTAGGATGYIEIPAIPTELSTITKEASVQQDNSVVWTITLGSNADTGVSLAGGTIVDILDGQQVWDSAYVGSDSSNKITFTQDANNENRYSYTFDEESTLTAPAKITVVTKPTTTVMSNTSDVVLTNNAMYIAKNSDKEVVLPEPATAILKKTTVEKKGTIIDGNTIEWNIHFNGNKANVFLASVSDTLSKGLTVDESFGIVVKDLDTNNVVTLKSGDDANKTLGDVGLTYTNTTAGEQQTIKVAYNNSFSHEYMITFRTNVSGEVFKGDEAKVNNTANVEVWYPDGSGNGAKVEWGEPAAEMVFKNGFVAIEGTNADVKNGELTWKVTPSSNANDYAGSVIKLTLSSENHGYKEGSFVLYSSVDNSKIDATKYSVAVSGNTIDVTLKSSSEVDSPVDINKVYGVFVTEASKDSYFANDKQHSYIVDAGLEIKGTTGSYQAEEKSATQTLQNKMVKKTVVSSYDETDNEALFTFTIDVNGNGINLSEAKLTDDLSKVLYVTDKSNLNTDNSLKSTAEAKELAAEDFKIKSVHSDKLDDVSFSGKNVVVDYGNLDTSDQVKIVVELTDAGKAKLKLTKDYSEKVLFTKNTATVTATELVGGGISSTVEGLSRDEIAINKALEKKGEQVVVEGENTATIRWTLNINNMGANLDKDPKIVDTIPAGLTLDKTTVKLYAASHGASGTLITRANKAKEVQSGDGFTFTSVKNKIGTTTLTLNLPTGNEAYVLQYETAIAGDPAKYSNTAEMHVDTASITVNQDINVKAISYGKGTIRAFLTMTKTDELSTSVAVKGAKYGIFASKADAEGRKEENTVDVGYTDAEGKLTFTVPGGINVKKTYYVTELVAPESTDDNGGGYKLDEKVYEISGVSYGKQTIGPKGFDDQSTFTDERKMETDENGKVKTGTAKITNTFKDDNVGGTTGGKHSRFTLYHEGKQVKLKLENGEYQFDGYGTGISLGGTDSTKSGSDSISNITITGLPWGNYELEETETAPGFVQEKTPVAFTVESDGTVKGPKNDDKINIDNVRTVLTITDNVEAEYEITGKFVGDTTTSTRTITGEELTQTGGKVYTGETIQGQTYTLVQTKIPDGYKKHENVTVADFDGDELVELTETPIKANVVIKDQDGEVPNAKIQIAPRDGSKLNETVDADNPLTLDQCVNIGSRYDLTVALDDDAYLPVDGASATLEVSADGSTVSTKPTDPSVLNSKVTGTTVTLTVQKIYANVEIREYSEEDKNPSTGEPKEGAKILTGGKFYLYDAATKKQIREVIVDENAEDKIDITDLPAGNYYLKQDTAPNAYTVINKDEEYSFVVDADKHGKTIYVNVFNHPVPGSIEVTKTNEDGTKALAGAVYQLYTKDAAGNRNVVATATTDANGKMKFEHLLWDTYYLSEVSAPAGYQVNNQVYGGDADWTIDVEHQHLVKEVSDKPTVVTIHTTGIDIRDGKDETDADVTKENIGNGVLPYSNLTYEVTGIFAGKTEESIEKFVDDDNDGLIKVSNMFVVGNTYTFTQKSVKRPYNKVENFTAEIKTGTDQIEIVNHMNRLAMQLVNGEGERLAGGTFELYQLDDAGNRVLALDKPLTSKIGKLDITGLVPGTYELVETDAPVVDGQFTYALDNSGMKFVLNENNTVKVLSTNADAARQNADAAKKNETKVDAVLGKAGSVLKMDEAVLTYVNVPTRLYFDVDVFYNEDCNKDKDATADLAGVYYTVCTPEDEDNGFCIMRPISDEEDGKVVVEGLPLGTYEVKMSDSKGNNVILNKEVYTAEVVGVPFAGLKYANGATVEQEVKDVNGEKTGVSVLKYNVYKEDLVLAKTDAEDDSKLLAGSTYRLYRKDSFQSKDAINYDKDKVEDEGTKFNEFVAEATTDADGKLTFEGVTVGVEYLVQEVGEPSGYQVSKDPIKVRFIRDNKLGTTTLQNINDGDGTAEVSEDGTVTWKEPRLKVAIRLVDEEGNPLSGGQLELKDDAAGSNKRSWTSSNQNELFSGELTGGQNYTVVQTAAPSGYQPSENVTFVAERKALSAKDDYVQVITVVNTKVAGATVKKDVTDSAATSAGTTTSATSDNHKVKVSSAWVHKSPKTNDSWFGDLVEWFLTK